MAAAGNDGVGIAVLAADAGMQGMPRLRAGGLNRAGFIGMSQRVKLLIGGVAAAIALAGIVGAPALLGAGGGLTGMADQVVFLCGQFHIGTVVAAGAGIVGFPADFRTGRRLRGMGDRVVSLRRQFHIGTVVAAGARIVGFPADFRTGRRLRFVMRQIMVVWIYIAAPNNFTVEAMRTNFQILSGGYAGGFGDQRFIE